MADLSKITLPNGSTYNLKDSNSYRIGPVVSHRNANNPDADPAYAILTTPKNALDYQFLRTVAGVGDWFYAAHLNPDYTITCNYSGKNGTKGYFAISTLFTPSAASTVLLDVDAIADDPFVLTIEKSSNITATDVVHLELFTHTIGQSAARLTDYKVELLTTGSTSGSGTYSWMTVYERHGVSDSPSGLCITLNSTSYSYIYFKGVRFTIEGATPGSTNTSAWNYNCLDLSLFRLMDQRPAFSAARSIGALDISGGDVYGYTRFRHGLEGNVTGNSSSATALATSGTIQTNLGSTDAKTYTSGGNITPGVTGKLPIANGGTNATDAAGARTNLGLGNVENKSSATIRGELTKSNVTTALGFTPYTQDEVNALVSSVFTYKGTKSTYAQVSALTDMKTGDVWQVTADNSEYVYNGSAWEKLGPTIDLSGYLTSVSVAGQTLTPGSNSITVAQLKTALGLGDAAYKDVETVLANDAKLPTGAAVKSFVEGKGYVTTDTKNTAGSTDTSSKIFLIGATSQAANPQTYSDNEVYATSGVLTTKAVQVGGTKATMQYNATTEAIDFIFS